MLGLRKQQSRLVDAKDFPCFQLSGWLVTAMQSSLRMDTRLDDEFLRIFQVVLLLFILLSILYSHGCYMCPRGHPHISSRGPLKTSSHLAVHIHVSTILTRLYCGKPSEVVPSFPFGQRSSLVIATMTLFSGLGTDVHFSGDETGLQWEDYRSEMQNAVEWRMVLSRGQDERSQMHAMSLLLNTCSDMTNRVLVDDGAKCILLGSE